MGRLVVGIYLHFHEAITAVAQSSRFGFTVETVMRRMRAVAPRLPRWISVVLGRVKVVPPRRALGFYFAPIAAVLAARHFLVGAFLPDVSSVGHPSIASSAISSGLLCLPPLWISSSRCINSARSSMTSSKAGKAGWLADRKPTRRERIACASIINRYQTMPSRMKVSDSTHDKL